MPPRTDKKRSAIVAVFSRHQEDELITLCQRHTTRTNDFHFGEFIETLPRATQATVWKGLSVIVDETAQSLASITDAEQADQQHDENGEPSCNDTDNMCEVLRSASVLLLAVLQRNIAGIATPELFMTMSALHDAVTTLPDDALAVQDQMSRVFETWWAQELPDREELMGSAVGHLLLWVTREQATVADIKRLLAVRSFFEGVDWDDKDTEAFRTLALRTAISPLFAQCDEGRRFVAMLMGLAPSMTDAVHAVIKNQIPAASRSLLEAFGDMYFRAWRTANAEGATHAATVLRIECGCLQDLMYHALHARRSGSKRPMATQLFTILETFHQQKRVKGVDEMLFRLYDPILWRALGAANADVRTNAATVFFAAFPLQDPDNHDAASTDTLMQRQFNVLGRLLKDVCPAVRAIAVQGTCRLLSAYWELIPAHVSATLIETLARDISQDATSATVRAQVIVGLRFLLDNHLAQVVLARFLPLLRPAMHDSSERVRSALVDLLDAVKKIRALRFWDIVPVPHLLARLECDSPAVALRITTLLQNSYFPLDKSVDVQLTRCVTLAHDNAAAARRFYCLLPRVVPTATLVPFVTTALSAASDTIDVVLSDDDDAEEEDGEEESSSGVNSKEAMIERVCAHLEASAVVVAATRSALEMVRHKDLKKELCDVLNTAVSTLLPRVQAANASATRSTTTDWSSWSTVWSALLSLARAIESPSRRLVSLVVDSLDTIDESHTTMTAMGGACAPLVACLCAWGKAAELTERMADWLTGVADEAFPSSEEDSNSSREEEDVDNDSIDESDENGNEKRVRVDKENGRRANKKGTQGVRRKRNANSTSSTGVVQQRPQLALAVLEQAMRDEDTRGVVLASIEPVLVVLRQAVDKLGEVMAEDSGQLVLAMGTLAPAVVQQRTTLLETLMMTYARAQTHRHAAAIHSRDDNNETDAPPVTAPAALSDLLLFADEHVVRALTRGVTTAATVSAASAGRKRKNAAAEGLLASSKAKQALAVSCARLILDFAADTLLCGVCDRGTEMHLATTVGHIAAAAMGSLDVLMPSVGRCVTQLGANVAAFDAVTSALLRVIDQLHQSDEVAQRALLASLRPAVLHCCKIAMQRSLVETDGEEQTVGEAHLSACADTLATAAIGAGERDCRKSVPASPATTESDLVPVAAFAVSLASLYAPFAAAVCRAAVREPVTVPAHCAAVQMLSVLAHARSDMRVPVARAVADIAAHCTDSDADPSIISSGFVQSFAERVVGQFDETAE